MSNHVRITDVSPRDGLQNEPGVISTQNKCCLIEMLSKTGVDEIEMTSFVSPRWVPQLGDAAQLASLLAGFKKPAGMVYSALVPNERGMEALLKANEHARDIAGVDQLIDKVAVFTAASEAFTQKNTNASIKETLARFEPVVLCAKEHRLATRGYISCVIQCPFQGSISPEQVAQVAIDLLELGIDEIDLGDTIGAGTPESITRLIQTVVQAGIDISRLTLHLHDTFNKASQCVQAALDLGVRSFDGSVAGLGGCPYASTESRQAPGNIALAALINTISQAGFQTGVDLNQLDEATECATRIVQEARKDAGSVES